ncbi:4-alpha-glucanotransferase [Marinobacter vulgaris]|uniref:4-alpha-glucanotransferase n=1 Tax=Marinobacter vulgaris TaxID=1928331 RepID=A0A2V3ZIN8_9GAMM|nr:4-alpha-glucanotransferase [Marinobacter vulgaris]PXX90802.1 4-alpha-glucanotransferase [Marinobacter vulgaris]TSJ70220.1 4-alpha-glucanotransferase [Marinobacter vulgaris]
MPSLHSVTINRLAREAGVHSGFRDVRGKWRDVTTATKRALLQSMGFPASSAEEAAASLTALQERRWLGTLPSVTVMTENEPSPCCDLFLATADLGRRLGWRIELEEGGFREGEIAPAGLTVEERKQVAGVEKVRLRLPLPRGLPLGYHTLALNGTLSDYLDDSVDGRSAMSLIMAPAHAHIPEKLKRGRKLWGLAVQLYGLRSQQNWGIGDFADLQQLVSGAAALGADTIALNPLHALFPGSPSHISPYGPSSREFLNTGYIALPHPQVRDEEGLTALRSSSLVNFEAVLPLKLRALERRFDSDDPDAADFRRFVTEGGSELRDLGVFQALSEHFGHDTPWRDWPAPYRNPASPRVAEFACDHRSRIDFFCYLQWLANRQLEKAATACEASGMVLGLCLDLAVGSDRWGAETWRQQALFATGASIGAPPDAFNLLGQDWGIPPMTPLQLREKAYRPFIRMLRANMRHAGALRVDHVLGWQRLYWIPEGASPDSGSYVSYPFDDMLAIAALESHRNRCAIIGEDLGTVPRGFRARLRKAGIFSTRLLHFERTREGRHVAPKNYPRLALASLASHDLPTLRGFITGQDLRLRSRYRLFPSAEERYQAIRDRVRDRRQLVKALQREDLLPSGHLPGSWLRRQVRELAIAAYRYLGRSSAGVELVYPEDPLEVLDQINLPGTTDEHPNWRRKLPLEVADLLADPAIKEMAAHLNRERGVSGTSTPHGESND